MYLRKGGYIAVRKSRHLPILHFIWVEDISQCKTLQYVPIEPKKGLIGFIDKHWFKGRIKRKEKSNRKERK